MFHLIPAALHRRLYRLAHALRRRWLRLRGGKVFGVSIIARDDRGRVLLVRHSYGSESWQFPSGGMRRTEQPESAVRREFAEELGCRLAELTPLGVVEEPYHGAVNVVHIFAGRVEGEPRPDGREVVEAHFFPPDGLPARLGQKTRERLGLLDL